MKAIKNLPMRPEVNQKNIPEDDQTILNLVFLKYVSVDELTNLFTKSQEILGGKIDFVLHSIGMSVNIRKKIRFNKTPSLKSRNNILPSSLQLLRPA